MKLCQQKNTVEHQNSDHCVVSEYPLDASSINMATAKITGRYPKIGYATNHKVHEMAYIQAGQGSLTVNNQTTLLEKGDVILVEPGDQFYWDGNLTLIIACTPAFTPEQHEVVQDKMSTAL